MIDVKRLNVIYPDGTVAVSDLSINIQKGQRTALIGANGAGKSTLLLSMLGIISKESGEILIDGIALSKKSLGEIREKVGMVFQNPDDQLFMPNVFDDLAFGPRNYGFSEDEVEKRVHEALETLGIVHLKEKLSHKLSGGEKRSTAIASVLTMKPSVLLLDEPSSFLDPRARKNLIEILSKLPMTQLIATHDLDLAYELCDRVIILNRGKLFADGEPCKLLTDEDLLHKSGLELPLKFSKI